MATIYHYVPPRAPRRPVLAQWGPEMAAAYSRLHPQTRVEHDGVPLAGTQLEMFKISRAAVSNIWR